MSGIETSTATRRVLRLPVAPLREMPATIAAVIVACGVEVGLRTLKLPTLARFVGAPLVSGDVAVPRVVDTFPLRRRLIVRLRAVRRVMRHWPFGDTCLRIALVSGQRIRELHPMLRIGVAKDADGVRAHAWLEVDGVSFDPTAPSEYAVLHSLADERSVAGA